MEECICEDCGKPAEWIYSDDTYLCDECVPRGVCYCQRQYVDTEWYEEPTFDDHPFIWGVDKNGDKYWTSVDSKGREYPCVDWMRL